ncbi:hypothetical protein AMTR_s00030p00014690 [Amborella trichopoda]|uniref:BZIP domain-containing protein n=2 Tax=Amborella trichopoda TaxID=13333 RepID=U5D0P2_AMBTC|nr:hypothetical protein AMTR_s00030p00014690 [Amborella trichopoda]
MPETPLRGSHRRAHSDIAFRLPDDVLFDSELDFGIAGIDIASFSEEANSGDILAGKSEDSGNGGGVKESKDFSSGSSHMRSLSVDAAFLESLGLQGGGGERKGGHRRVSSSGSGLELGDNGEGKKVMGPDKLAELSLIDPKRAKRILANRQSAARSKERKIRYTSELERKVQTLQTEATTLSAQLTLLQRDTTGLTQENKELKLRLQAMEQQAHLRDALNEALREEVQRLKVATGQIQGVNGNHFNRGLQQPNHSFFPQQQMHSHQLPPRHVSQPSPPNNQSQHGHLDFLRGSTTNNHGAQ